MIILGLWLLAGHIHYLYHTYNEHFVDIYPWPLWKELLVMAMCAIIGPICWLRVNQ